MNKGPKAMLRALQRALADADAAQERQDPGVRLREQTSRLPFLSNPMSLGEGQGLERAGQA